MPRYLSDEDVEAVARRVVTLLGERLTATTPPPPVPPLPVAEESKRTSTRLAYTLKQLCEELSVSRDTMWKFEARGLIKSLPGIRRKIYSRAEVERFLAGGESKVVISSCRRF